MWIITLLVVGQCPAGSSHCLFVAKPGKTLNFVFTHVRTGHWKCASSAVADLGEGARAGSPLCLDQTEARRGQKKILKDTPPPPPLSGGLDLPLPCTSYSYPGFYFFRLSTMATGSHGRPISFMPTTLPGSPAAATILTSPSSATGPGNFDSLQ